MALATYVGSTIYLQSPCSSQSVLLLPFMFSWLAFLSQILPPCTYGHKTNIRNKGQNACIPRTSPHSAQSTRRGGVTIYVYKVKFAYPKKNEFSNINPQAN